MDILVFILGLIASIFIVGFSLAKDQRRISILNMLLSIVLIAQYLLLAQPTATILSALTLIYSILIYGTIGRTDRFSRAANSTFVRICLLGAYTAVFMLLNGGLGLNVQLFAYLGSVLMVAVMMVKNVWITKGILLAACICWTAFQFQTGAHGNLVGQAFTLAALGWSSRQVFLAQRSARDESKTATKLAVA